MSREFLLGPKEFVSSYSISGVISKGQCLERDQIRGKGFSLEKTVEGQKVNEL